MAFVVKSRMRPHSLREDQNQLSASAASFFESGALDHSAVFTARDFRRYSSPPLRHQIKLVFRRLQGIDHGNIMVSASARIAEGAVSSPV
ncbi:hypothetical protein evm_008894 [Chilo suppressalis]|nr:hypothetical protein evm_008894 [Chilo suppressalis]